MRIVCIIQARMGSTRLPGKVLMDIGGKPMLWHVIKRVMAVPTLKDHSIIVATPDERLFDYARELDRLEKTGGRIRGYLWDGDPNDVLGRYARIATEMAAGAICRVTGDCPLLDPKPISDVLNVFTGQMLDYVANDIERTWPDGMGVEVFSNVALQSADQEARNAKDREHVSPFMMRDRRNSRRNIRCPINGLSDLKLSVDTQDDLDFVRAIDAAGPKDYSLKATLEAVSRVQAKNLAIGA